MKGSITNNTNEHNYANDKGAGISVFNMDAEIINNITLVNK